MSDFDDKLNAILGNQDAMSQIMALAQSLSGAEERVPEKSCCAPETVLPMVGQDEQLLAALRPYLKGSRQRKLDRALELLRLLRLFKGSGE